MVDNTSDSDINYNNCDLAFNSDLDYIMSPPPHQTAGTQRIGTDVAGALTPDGTSGASRSSLVTQATANFAAAIDNNTALL